MGPTGRARRQHEGQQGGALAGGDDLAEHTGERHHHAQHEHHGDAHPRMGRHQRAEGDQNQAVESQTGVGEGTRRAVAGKVDQDQQRHRAEDGEQRRLRTTSDGEPDAGRDRNHDGRPRGAP